MTVRATAVPVGTTPTLLTESGSAGADGTQAFLITNAGAVTVYLGGPTVTTTTGSPIVAGEKVGVDLVNVRDELYAVTASGTCDVRVLLTDWNP